MCLHGFPPALASPMHVRVAGDLSSVRPDCCNCLYFFKLIEIHNNQYI